MLANPIEAALKHNTESYYLALFICNFMPLGLNEADTLKCSSVLIYSISDQSIFAKVYGIKPRQLKRVRLKYGGNCSFFTAFNQWGIINFDYEFWY